MRGHVGILLDNAYSSFVPELIPDRFDFQAFEEAAGVWDWSDRFATDMGDATLSWLSPSRLGGKIGGIGFQWKPEDGETLDATGFVLPGINRVQENKFMLRVGIDAETVRVVVNRPQVFISVRTTRLLRRKATSHDGNNRMVGKDELLNYVCNVMGLMGFFSMKHLWNLDVFN